MITTRRQRRRTERPRPLYLLISGILVTLAVGIFVAAGLTASSGLPGLSYERLYAELPDVGNLKPHDEVRIAGTRVGQVLETTTDGRRTRVRLQLDGDLGALPLDTTAVVRARGLLGTRFLELRPGTSTKVLPDEGTMRGAGLAVTSGVPDVLDTFDAETRGGLRATVDGLGESLAGRGRDVGAILEHGPDLAGDLDTVATTVLERPGAARVLLPSLSSGLSGLDGAREDIARAFGPTADGLDPFVRARTGAQATLDAAPATLQAVTGGLGAGRSVLSAVRKLARAVNTSLPEAPAALARTTTVLRRSGPALDRTASLLRAVRPTVPKVLQMTRALSPNLAPLRQTFDGPLPLLKAIDAHSCDVRNFADNWRSALGFGTPAKNDIGGDLGPLNQFRIQLISGAEALGGLAPAPVPFPDQEVYTPACRDSPGGIWTPAGTDEPGQAAAR